MVVETRSRFRTRSIPASIEALRPRQWLKNAFVFAGLVFAARFDDASLVRDAFVCFAIFCAASSAAYLMNDARDTDGDRRHPVKCNRPIARGDLSLGAAYVLATILAAVALIAAAALSWALLAWILSFLILQATYTLWLKRIVLFDVLVIGALFVLRAAAGATAVHVPISHWLLMCTGLLALFLGFAKRRGELLLVGAGGSTRTSLEGYTLELVDQLLTIVATATILTYGLYTVDAHKGALLLTTPFVLFGVFRYLVLVHRDDLGEEPERALLGDLPLLLSIAVWAIVAAVILKW